MGYWGNDMRNQGHGMVMTSTHVDEEAQCFYRKLGYKDCGGFIVESKGFEQAIEIILNRAL